VIGKFVLRFFTHHAIVGDARTSLRSAPYCGPLHLPAPMHQCFGSGANCRGGDHALRSRDDSLTDSHNHVLLDFQVWQVAYIVIPWTMWKHYGTDAIPTLERHYDGMVELMGWFNRHADPVDHLLVTGEHTLTTSCQAHFLLARSCCRFSHHFSSRADDDPPPPPHTQTQTHLTLQPHTCAHT
jgi:hypothetical protein